MGVLFFSDRDELEFDDNALYDLLPQKMLEYC